MNEYSVKVQNGQLFTVFAYNRCDIPDVMERDHGYSRWEISRIRLVEPHAAEAIGEQTAYALCAA